MVVANRPVDQGSEGAVGLLESRRLDDGNGNLRRLSSHGKCGARVHVRHQFSQKGAATYLLSKDDMAGFEKALYGVKDFLSH